MLPWARALNNAQNEPNTLIYSIYRTKSREPYFHWFCPISTTPAINLYVLNKSKKGITISSLADAKKHAIGTVRGDFVHDILMENGFLSGGNEINIDVVSSDESNLNNWLNGRIDIIFMSEGSMDKRMESRNIPKDNYSILYQLSPNELPQNCFALNKNSDKQVVERLNKVFSER